MTPWTLLKEKRHERSDKLIVCMFLRPLNQWLSSLEWMTLLRHWFFFRDSSSYGTMFFCLSPSIFPSVFPSLSSSRKTWHDMTCDRERLTHDDEAQLTLCLTRDSTRSKDITKRKKSGLEEWKSDLVEWVLQKWVSLISWLQTFSVSDSFFFLRSLYTLMIDLVSFIALFLWEDLRSAVFSKNSWRT